MSDGAAYVSGGAGGALTTQLAQLHMDLAAAARSQVNAQKSIDSLLASEVRLVVRYVCLCVVSMLARSHENA